MRSSSTEKSGHVLRFAMLGIARHYLRKVRKDRRVPLAARRLRKYEIPSTTTIARVIASNRVSYSNKQIIIRWSSLLVDALDAIFGCV